jgi:two-component system, NarL family, nitrate/nitrite response regulator NarL
MGETINDFYELPRMESLSVFVIGTVADVTVPDFISIIVSVNPKARIVVLADAYDHAEATAVLALGAKGYLHKSLSSESFVKALQLISEECSVISGWPMSNSMGREAAALSGGTSAGKASSQFRPLSQRQSAPPSLDMDQDSSEEGGDLMADQDMQAETPARTVRTVNSGARNLSPREKSILKLVMGGESNKQIARRLEITESTVKVHIKTILRKIDVKNRTQAAIWAMAEPGFTEPGHT